MEKIHKEILLKKYNEFDIENNVTKKKLLFFEIKNILENENNLDSEDYYIWGLTHYYLDDDIEWNKKLALEKFLKAFQIDSSNFLACLYMAHCYQDTNELKAALKSYELVDKEKLKEFQLWRYVKLIEQIGYCYYKLGKVELGQEKFEEVLIWYKKTPSIDLVYPTELMECLPLSNDFVDELKNYLK